MNFKKVSLSALVVPTLLLAVGCSSSNVLPEQEISQDGDFFTVNEDVIKYADNIEVRAFFELAEKAKDMTSQEFIEAIKEMDKYNTLSIERTDYDNSFAAWYCKLYTIKTLDSSTVLRISAIESDGEEEIPNENSVESLQLLFNEENVSIKYYVSDNSYSVEIEGEQPIISNESLSIYKQIDSSLSKYKELDGLDKKYIALQERFKDNKNITIEEIKEIINEDELEVSSGLLQHSPEDINVDDIEIEGENSKLEITLEDGKELYTIAVASDDLRYGYERADYSETGDKTVKGDRYYFRRDGFSKGEVTAFLHEVF